MKLPATKLLGLAAITLALGVFVSNGTALACEKSEKTKSAKATALTKSTSKTQNASSTASSSCDYSKTKTASLASKDACGDGKAKTTAVLAGADCCDVGAAKAVIASGASGCEARKAKMALASAEGCESHKAKTSTAALASAEGCESHKTKTSTAALASAEGCESHKTKTSTAALGSAEGCAAHKSAALADAESGCTMTKSAAFASACARYEACSVKADLAHAKDADLEIYEKEKKQDGVAISGVKLPAFYATDLEGNKVSSKDLKGQPTVLVLLATHCGHSYSSLPILTAAAEEFGPRGLRVVGLVVGSSPEKAKGWFEGEMSHEVWVTEDLTVADKLQSHLVPTYVLVDAKGNVKTKLVGFKKDAEVKENIPVLLVQSGATESGKS